MKSDATFICLAIVQKEQRACVSPGVGEEGQFTRTHDQTSMPPSFCLSLQIICMVSSENLITHFFCSFSIACTISMHKRVDVELD